MTARRIEGKRNEAKRWRETCEATLAAVLASRRRCLQLKRYCKALSFLDQTAVSLRQSTNTFTRPSHFYP